MRGYQEEKKENLTESGISSQERQTGVTRVLAKNFSNFLFGIAL
jgi:hypothetical protein